MKNIRTLTILISCLTMTFVSCKDKDTKEAPLQNKPQPLKLLDSSVQTQISGSAWHYTCSNGCSGGAAVAGNCSTCGSVLVHNQTYHNNSTNTTTNSSTTPTVKPETQNPEPSQNAAGVWHYTCSKGCSGGSGSASKCSTCGATLAHNTAYHQ